MVFAGTAMVNVQFTPAQQVVARDRLPRRVLSIRALVSRLWGEYTCRQSYPACRRAGFSGASCLQGSLVRHGGA